MDIHAVILAAGRGKRMQSDLPKVLHVLAGKPLLWHVLDQVKSAGITSATVVVSYKKELVIDSVTEWARANAGLAVNFADQGEPKGTGHALLSAEAAVPAGKDVAVCLGDVPGIQAKTISGIFNEFKAQAPAALVVSMKLADPKGYGRIVRSSSTVGTKEDILSSADSGASMRGTIIAITEEKDASDEIRKINEVNTGIFFFKGSDLWPGLKKIQPQNAQGEYYLTDMVQILLQEGKKVSAYLHPNANEFRGVNSQEDLNQLAS